ncbi:MAG: ADP-ribosylation factor-like protein [Promethearchaeota archaeon]
MLREIHVLRETDLIYWRQFGDAIPWEQLSPTIFSIIYSLDSSPDKFEGILPNIMEFKVSYSAIKELKLLFVFVTDTTDSEKLIKIQLDKAKEEFQDLFSEKLIRSATDPTVFNSFNPIADLIHKNLRPKISLVGFSGVGKTTITKLIRADDIPMVHNPTMTGDIYTVKIGKLHFNLWDFAGQEQFSFLWPKFIKDSDAVLIITDSSLKNIEKSKSFSELARVNVPKARVSAIANKQDLPDSLTSQEVEKIIGIKTHGMIAIEPNNRAKMIEIVAEVLGITSQVSPLIQPLLNRDKLVDDAEIALTKGEFTTAVKIFEEIAKFSIELGDSKMATEFLERAKFIESKISGIKRISQELETETSESNQITAPLDSKTPIEIVTPSEITASKKIVSKIYDVFDFGLKLTELYNFCENKSSKNTILLFLKELQMKALLDFPDLKINVSLNNWFTNLERINDIILPDRTYLNLQFDILNWFDSFITFSETNTKFYLDSPYIDEKTSKDIENGNLKLKEEFENKSNMYANKILVNLMIIQKGSGINFFYHNFTGEEVDSQLISGFITGIGKFGSAVSKKETSMRKLSYEDFEIEQINGEYTTAALILSGYPNELIINILKEFITKFETKYGVYLQDFDGNVSRFENSDELVRNLFSKLKSDEVIASLETQKSFEIAPDSDIKIPPEFKSADIPEEFIETSENEQETIEIEVKPSPEAEKATQELLKLELELEKITFTLSELKSNYQNNVISDEDYQKEKDELNKLKKELLYKITQAKINLIK